MQQWPPFQIWYGDLLNTAHAWNVSGNVVESIPMDWLDSCWRNRWHPGDALIAALQDFGMMDEQTRFIP